MCADRRCHERQKAFEIALLSLTVLLKAAAPKHVIILPAFQQQLFGRESGRRFCERRSVYSNHTSWLPNPGLSELKALNQKSPRTHARLQGCVGMLQHILLIHLQPRSNNMAVCNLCASEARAFSGTVGSRQNGTTETGFQPAPLLINQHCLDP